MTRSPQVHHSKHKTPESAYSLVFKIKGENEYGAATGTLTLAHHGKTVHESEVFSGGLRHPERYSQIPSATYRLRLDIRGHLSSVAQLDRIAGRPGVFKAHEFYGIEDFDLYRPAFTELLPGWLAARGASRVRSPCHYGRGWG